MPEQHPQADEAARYVLGQLPPSARHEFEVQLTQSAELRALVQELEDGVEAMARAVPQRPPPPQTWSPIERAIAQEAERKVVTLPGWSNWWRNGWAAAAACLLAFLSYAWWPQRKETPSVTIPVAAPTSPSPELATVNPPVELTSIKPTSIRPQTGLPTNPTVAPGLKPKPETTNPELTTLRGQVAALQMQLEHLSEIVTQQKAIMAEPGRFKFFPLTSSTTTDGNTPPAPLSAGLQRAMFYAMARDMGWLPSLAQGASPAGSTAGARVFAGVDFVDLNSPQDGSAFTASTTTQVPAEPETTSAASVSVSPSGNIPGFVGTNLVMLFDRSIIPQGGPMAFWTVSEMFGYQLVGSAVLGENPLVVTLPVDQMRNGNLTVTSVIPGGPSNVVGQFSIVRYPQSPGRPPP